MDTDSFRNAKDIRARIYRDLRSHNARRADVAARVLEARHGRRIERAMHVAREHRFSSGR